MQAAIDGDAAFTATVLASPNDDTVEVTQVNNGEVNDGDPGTTSPAFTMATTTEGNYLSLPNPVSGALTASGGVPYFALDEVV